MGIEVGNNANIVNIVCEKREYDNERNNNNIIMITKVANLPNNFMLNGNNIDDDHSNAEHHDDRAHSDDYDELP